jgi:hypothetical protein
MNGKFTKFSLKRSAIWQGNLFDVHLFGRPLKASHARKPSIASREDPIMWLYRNIGFTLL